MAEGDSTFGEIVGGKLKSDFIAGENADAIAAEAAGEVSEHKAFVLQLHTEFTAGELFNYRSLDFDAVFFTHSGFLSMSYRSGTGRPVGSTLGRAGSARAN